MMRRFPLFPFLGSVVVLLSVLSSGLIAQQTSRAGMIDGARVISSDARSVTIEYTPRIQTSRLTSGEILPVVEGGGLANLASPGEPMRVVVDLPVVLPSGVGNTLEVVAVEYDQPLPGRIAPVPTMPVGRDGIARPNYQVKADAYRNVGALPPVADIHYKGVARDLHVGSITIAPYEFNPVTNTIRFLRSLKVRLRYGASSVVNSGVRRSGLLPTDVFLNGAGAASWAQPLPSVLASFGKLSSSSAAQVWMRVDVKEDGLYAITADDFQRAGIDVASIDPGKIAIYGGNGADLSESVPGTDVGDMQQVPTIVEQSGGRVSQVLFYGVGPTVWVYRSALDSVPTHISSPYVTANSYIIAIGGDNTRGFTMLPDPGAAATRVSYGTSHLLNEEDKYNAVTLYGAGGSGRDWFATQFQTDIGRPTDTRVFQSQLFDVDRSVPVNYRVRVANAAKTLNGQGAGTFTYNQNGSPIGAPMLVSGTGGDLIALAQSRLYQRPASEIPGDNRSLLGITYTNSIAGSGYLDWFEIHYGRRLVANGDQLKFEAPSGTGIGEFSVINFSNNDLLGFDVTDPVNPVRLPGAIDGAAFTFRDQLRTPRAGHSYFVTSRSAARRVENPQKAIFGDLRSRLLNADILVIAHDDLRDAAENYVRYRNGRGQQSAAYVTVGEIYTEFSHGNLDPTAIRDYVAYAIRHWTRKPTYLLLLGDGSYDYRTISTKQKPLVPPYETDDGDAYDHINSSSFDDYFVRVIGDDRLVDLSVGRLPVETPEQATDVIEKIKRYEGNSNYGSWRETVILAADDDYPRGEGDGFTRQSESLWSDMIPTWMEPRKIYLGAYTVPSGGIRKIPAAAQDLELALDRGAVITNWVGHGNPNVWAHEDLLKKDELIPSLSNDSVLTYVPAVTCNFGYFDDPTVVSGGELFVLQKHGGAIGVMTATRAVFIPPNERLMRQHFAFLFKRDSLTRQFLTIGQALTLMKLYGSGDYSNDQKFFLLGDPAMRLNLPKDSVEITSINTTNVATDTAVIGALSVVTIKGVVRDQFGRERSDFNGTAIVSLYDADRNVTVNAGATISNVLYYGGRLFRGPANVVNGLFSVTFRVPKDIAYDTATGRVSVYAYNDHEDAAGMTNHVRIYGSDNTPITDNSGPVIKIFMDDRTFASGDVVTPQPLLIVDLADSSGINSSGSGLGHRIEAWFDGRPLSVDLTESYTTLPTDYREGSAQKRILDLEPGDHSVRVRSWDIFNNPAEATAYFRIVETGSEKLVVVDVVNYPNPMERETDFLFRHNQTSPLDVDVDIFTASGRKVRRLESRSVTDRFVRIHWDGTDTDGHLLANGVYLYRLRVRAIGDDTKTFETIEKVAIVR